MNYSTCSTIQEFHYADYAITPQGLIKRGGRQLRKDDRFRIDDRSRYILGWDTREKIRTLEMRIDELSGQIQENEEHLERCKFDDRNLSDMQKVCNNLLFLDSFKNLDIKPLTALYQDKIDERHKLENSNDILKDLELTRDHLEKALEQCTNNIAETNRRIGGLTDRLNETNALLEDLGSELSPLQSYKSEILAGGKLLQQEAGILPAVRTENEIHKHIDELFAWNKLRMKKSAEKVREIEQKLVGSMSNLGGKLYPADMREFGNTINSLDEYRLYYEHLIQDDLPQFKTRFKRMLNQETVQSIVQFRQHLEFVREQMEKGIRDVNWSMKEINFSDGRYLELIARNNPDMVIREFKSELRSCTEDSSGSGEDDVFSEARFVQVKKLIERFRNESRWTSKVCDVRNWMVFQISEKQRKDDLEVARYSDSNRKSGGEKEKLAYTILAASLAYQFGLKLGETRSDSFRFVMIDEAFHKASSDSTHYGMELFKLFNLQLLLVTPNKDIPIIEQYVSTVGLTHKNESSHSMLYTTDIETFIEKRNTVEAGKTV
ncbi:SbcC/MukB-like Walker B domain-containing protein [Salinispira pacifica]|uniref:SbcC/MukB-like Walker B domain-containing protein n=1 Tax=Salinispira pacifica TaxID=1307761 RepID=UPI00146FBD53|nr:SbcC/MukB-like Walker B domain-containing protein [Salinispira pacifica]